MTANNNNAANVQAGAALSNGAQVNSALNNIVGAYGVSQGLGSSYAPRVGVTPAQAGGGLTSAGFRNGLSPTLWGG